MEQHLDLVRNDWAKEVQKRVAVVIVGGDPDRGAVVRQEGNGADWQGKVIDALGDTIGATSEEIVGRLKDKFHGSYLFALGPHSDAECPFASGPVQMKSREINGKYVLPA